MEGKVNTNSFLESPYECISYIFNKWNKKFLYIIIFFFGILFGHIIDYNKKLVEKIYEERIQEKTIAILVKTFLECLEHFRGNKFYKELEGLKKEYQNVIKSFRDIDESEEYIQIFQDLVNRFEDYYENKKSRNTKKSNSKDNENENEI